MANLFKLAYDNLDSEALQILDAIEKATSSEIKVRRAAMAAAIPDADNGCGATQTIFGREFVCGGHERRSDGTVLCNAKPLDGPLEVTADQLSRLAEREGLDATAALAHRCAPSLRPEEVTDLPRQRNGKGFAGRLVRRKR